MKPDFLIQGSGGKSGGGAKEAPNTVRSEAVAKILDLICAGQIFGFVTPADPLKSIYYDNLPVHNDDGSANNYGVEIEYTLGTMDQDPIKGFDAVETTEIVGVQATLSVLPAVTVTDPNVDTVMVTASIPALTKANSKTGALEGTWVSFNWQIKGADEGTWTTVISDYISEKFTTTTAFDYLIDISAKTYPVSVRLARVTAESESISLQNDLYFGAYTEIISEKLSYPGSVLIAHTVQAKQFGSSLPSRGAHIFAQLCLIPSNYNPWTRVYTGVWDGTFTEGWTSNPAWILLSCLVNTDWGLGEYISITDIDKVALYTIAEYCDELVDDGLGSTEPRYAFNAYIQTQESAATVIQAISSSFQGMTFAATSKILFAQDAPSDPVALVTNANVIGGSFQYEGIGVGTRKSAYMVEWNNPDKNYELDYEFCEDAELIAKYGYKMERLPLVGCTSRGQARRAGKWRLFTNKFQDRMISYKASLDHGFILPGSLIRISDSKQQTYRYGGRIVSATSTTATLDHPTTLESGKTYQLHWVDPEGVIQTRTITTGVGEASTFTVSVAMDVAVRPVAGAVWIMTSGEEVPYRVMAVREVGGRQPFVEIVAAKHYDEKYELIEGEASLEITRAFTVDSKVPILPPTNGVFTKRIRNTAGVNNEYLEIAFDPSLSARAQYYSVSYRHNYGEWQTVTTYTDSIYVPWEGAGRYQASILARGIGSQQDAQSIPLFIEENILDARPIEKATIDNLALGAGSVSSSEFSGGTAKFVWEVGLPTDFTNDFWEDPYFRDFQVRITTTADVLISDHYTRNPFWEYTSERNAEENAGVPRRSFKIGVRIRDTFGSEETGDFSWLTVSNNAPAAPTVLSEQATNAGISIELDPSDDRDWAGTLVWYDGVGTLVSGDPNRDFGKTNSIFIPGAPGELIHYRIAYYDEFGKTSLNLTTEDSVTIPLISEAEFDESFTTALEALVADAAASEAAAAASQAAAAASQTAALASQTAAATSATASAASATSAATAAANAATAEANAETAEAAAEAALVLADAAAAAAAVSSTSAGSSATTAAGSATTATTQAGLAATSASAASVSSVSAQSVANRLVPERPAVMADFVSGTTNGDPATATPITGTVVAVANEGDVFERSNSATAVMTRGALLVSTGRTFRLAVRMRITVDGTTCVFRSSFNAYDSAWAHLGQVGLTDHDANFTVADGWQTYTIETTSTAILAAWPTAVYVRGRGLQNPSVNNTWQVAFIRLQDITSESAAAGSATAASTSASSAATSATAAGTSASAASTSETNAATSAGAASTSATNASNSATTASGHAATASTQATAAATSATAAAGSASAASTSASTASTQATNAGNSATAAASSAVSAQSVANNLVPNRPSVVADYTPSIGTGDPASISVFTAGTTVAVAGEGDVREFTSVVTIQNRGWLPVVAGATYRRRYRSRVTVDGTSNVIRVGINVYSAAGASLGFSTFNTDDGNHVVADGWVTYDTTVTATTILAAYPTAAYVRTFGVFGGVAAGTSSGATVQLAILEIANVTSETAAATSATAAATSASSASTSATAAGTSATSASTSATNAATSAGAASTSATNASASATTASGHASTASTQATAAATSATAARGTAIAIGIGASDFNDDGLYWTETFGGTAAAATDPTATYANVTGIGRVMQITASAGRYFTQKYAMTPRAGRKYKISAYLRVTADATGGGLLSAGVNNVNGLSTTLVHGVPTVTLTTVSGLSDTTGTITVASGWQTIAVFLALGTPSTYDAFWRPRLDLFRSGGAGGSFEVSYIRIEDVTESEAAAGSATAAATSATTASTQATNSGNSATAAAASAVTAQSVANRLIPERPSVAADFVASLVAGDPLTATPLAVGTVVAIASEGDVREFTSYLDIVTRGALSVGSGRTFRLTYRSRVTVDGTLNRARSSFYAYDSSWTNLGGVSATTHDTSFVAADGWQTYTHDTTSALIVAAFPTAAYIRARTVMNQNTSGGASGATTQLAFQRLEDVTDSAAAAASSAAAATSASSASTSATAAGTSATAAAASAVTAQSIANNLVPNRPSVVADYTSSIGTGDPASIAAFTAGTTVAVAGEGDVRQFTSVVTIQNRGWLPVVAGATYRRRFRSRVTVDGTGNVIRVGINVYSAAGASLGFSTFNTDDVSHVIADGWVTFDTTVTATTILASYPTAAYVRTFAIFAGTSGGASSGSTVQVAILEIANITSETAAAASATASAGSASTASTQATNAAASATAALASQTAAASSASGASTSASTATTQASAASASASAASASATLSANYALSGSAFSASDFTSDGTYWYNGFGGAPLTRTDPSGGIAYADVTNIGRVMRVTTFPTYLSQKAVIRPTVGRRYRLTVECRAQADASGGTLSISLGQVNGLDTSYNHGAGNATVYAVSGLADSANLTVAGGWVTVAREFSLASASTYDAAWRIRIDLARSAGSGGAIDIRKFLLEDLTETTASNASIVTNASAIATETTARAAADTTLTARANTTYKASQNLVKNSTFINSGTDWTLTGSPTFSGSGDNRYVTMTATSYQSAYQLVEVVAGRRYSLSGEIYRSTSGMSSRLYIQWFNVSMGSLGYGDIINHSSTGWLAVKVDLEGGNTNMIAPTNAVYARIYVDNYQPSSYPSGESAMRRINFHGGDYAVPWTEGPTEATVTEIKTAVVDGSGAYSYFGLKVAAGNRFASIEAMASTKTNVTQLRMTADTFRMYNTSSDIAVFDITGTQIKIVADLNVSAGITVGSARLKVALESILRTGADGAAITWASGVSIGNIPEYVLDLSSLAALTTGEQYSVYLTSVTATGATVYAKIITPGTTSTVTQTTDAAGGGGDPTRVMAKSDSADAYDGYYSFRVVGTVTVVGTYDGELGAYVNSGGMTIPTYFNDGGGWDAGPTIEIIYFTVEGTDRTGSQAFDVTESIAWANAIGAGSTYDFGVSSAAGGTVTDLHTVSYTKQTSSGLRTASPSSETVKITALPRNA